MLVLFVVLYTALLIKNSGCFEAIETNTTVQRRYLVPKIIGGIDADISYFPSTVALLENTMQVCGGTIIGLKIVLTAAHCFDRSKSESEYSVRAGSSYRTKGGTIYEVHYYHLHEKYNEQTIDYDYAIVKIKNKFSKSQVSELVSTAVPPLTQVTIVGWGASDTQEAFEQLQYSHTNVIPLSRCKSLLPQTRITSRMLCTYAMTKKAGNTCVGDSGGPLFYGKLLAGVTSWGVCQRNSPAISSDVLYVSTWIKKFL